MRSKLQQPHLKMFPSRTQAGGEKEIEDIDGGKLALVVGWSCIIVCLNTTMDHSVNHDCLIEI